MNEIVLYGTVGASWWDEEYFTPSTVRRMLDGLSGPLTVRLNSGGGIATDGQAIYTILRDYPGEVHVVVDGIAASAASLIAMAGDTITMRAGALMMIHDPGQPWTEGRGTEADHLKLASVLATVSTAYARIYAGRAGITLDEARAIMREETYYDGPAALAARFATAVDDAQEAQAVARFDYRIYGNAPEVLQKAGRGVARAREKGAVLAMIAGLPAKPKERTMGKTVTVVSEQDDLEKMAETEEELEETTAAEDEDVPAEVEEDDEDEAATAAAEAPRAAKILDLFVALGRPVAEARAAIAERLTLEQAVDRITAQKRKENPLSDTPLRGNPTARITRDERDTRRLGMAGAIEARMSGAREVRGPARDFMAMTLAEMAAVSMGRTGRVARGAGELRALEMAFGTHSTSDLPAVFENALNKRLLAAYTAATPTYRAIAQRMDFMDFRPHPISGVGDWPTLLPVGEAGEIRFGTVSDKKENVALVAYARGLSITRQMIVNDDLGAIERLLSTRGRAVAAFEDQNFHAMFLSGANADGPTLLETSRQVFNTTDLTKASGTSVISPAAVAVGVAAMRKRKSVSGEAFLSVNPTILLTGPDKEFEALQLLAPIQAAQATNVNPYVNKMTPVTSPYITGNAWYLFADPADVPTFMYGYLQGEAGPRMRMEEPFGQQGLAYTVELDFGVGAVDFRGGWKNAGA